MLTEAGERYFEMIAENVDRISDATQNVRGYRSVTSLIVRATPSLSTKWLLPRLGRFLDANPDFDVRLDATNEPTDFSREGVDIEIRHGEGNWPGLFVEGARRGALPAGLRPDLLRAGRRSSPPICPGYRLIHSVKSQMQWPRWFAAAGVVAADRWRRVLFDRSHMAIDAAVNGIGIALESDLMMWRELRDGTARSARSGVLRRLARHPVARLPARSPAAAPGPRLPRLDARGARSLAAPCATIQPSSLFS